LNAVVTFQRMIVTDFVDKGYRDETDKGFFALACLHADIATVRGVGATREKGVKESSGTSTVQPALCSDFEW